MSPVQSIPPTVSIASPPSSNNATSYYNNHNIIENYNNNYNNYKKYSIEEISATRAAAATTTTTTTLNKTQRPRKVMSDALSISNITQKQMAYEPSPTLASASVGVGINGGSGGIGGSVSVEQSAVAAVAAAAAYQFNYNHLYADRAAVTAAMYGHGPPIMFSAPPPPPAHPMFTVSTQVPAHAYKLNNNNNNNINDSIDTDGAATTITDSNTVFSSAYLKAIQNAVTASIFNPTQMTSQLQPSSQISSHMPRAQTLSPPTPTLSKSPTLLAASMSSLAVSCTASSPNISSAHSNSGSNNNNTNNNKTYLNEKSINAKNMTKTADVNYFKVPSGKEGSLKHRILTRPQNCHAQNLSISTTATSSSSSSTTTTNNFNSMSNYEENNSNDVMCTYDSTSNFLRGSCIDLGNGVFRKVEDMRTEDFILCAERSPLHKLAESTVVKIDLTPANTVIITFSYNNNRSRADVEVSHDHPFFVYGQGWASYNPDASATIFSLKCQRLQVGDICISLTIRDAEAKEFTVPPQQQHKPLSMKSTTKDIPVTPTAMNMTISAVQPTEYSRYQMSATDQYANTHVLPLSPHTPPAALVTSNNHLSMPPTHYAVTPAGLPYHLLPPHLAASLVGSTHPYTSAEMADLVSAYAYHANTKLLGNHHHHYYHHQSQSPHIYHNEGANISKDNKMQDVIDFKHYAARYEALPPPLPPPVSTHSHHGYTTDGSHYLTHPHHHQHQHNHHIMHQTQEIHQQPQQDEPVDATIARKRRWSAPEGVCDDDDEDDIKYQPVRLSSVSSSNSSSIQYNNNNNTGGNSSNNSSSSISSNSGVSMYKIFKPAPVVAAAPPL